MDNGQIATAIHCPLANVNANWPIIKQALYQFNQGSLLSSMGVLATIAVETAHLFKPIKEFGSDALHEKEYGMRHDLGNTMPLDGAKYAGRGFIQITGKLNYASYSKLLGLDLVNNPDLALLTSPASRILALYWRDHAIAGACEQQDWQLVRKKVDGGLNGYTDFISCINRLKAIQTQ